MVKTVIFCVMATIACGLMQFGIVPRPPGFPALTSAAGSGIRLVSGSQRIALPTSAGLGPSVSLPSNPAPIQQGSSRLVAYLLARINADRAASGLPPLVLQTALDRAAVQHSLDMATHRYLSHFTPSGLSPYQRMRQQGVHDPWEGENVGYDPNGTNRNVSLSGIEDAMLKSPEHRANLLRPTFSRVGIGIVVRGSEVFVTEDFGGLGAPSRGGASPAPRPR